MTSLKPHTTASSPRSKIIILISGVMLLASIAFNLYPLIQDSAEGNWALAITVAALNVSGFTVTAFGWTGSTNMTQKRLLMGLLLGHFVMILLYLLQITL